MSRSAQIDRKTNETEISVSLTVDGIGQADINTGIGFLDHMLEQLARHSLMDITLNAKGDLHIDDHHTTEDTGWAIGEALNKALGERAGIHRYASSYVLHFQRYLSQCDGSPVSVNFLYVTSNEVVTALHDFQ